MSSETPFHQNVSPTTKSRFWRQTCQLAAKFTRGVKNGFSVFRFLIIWPKTCVQDRLKSNIYSRNSKMWLKSSIGGGACLEKRHVLIFEHKYSWSVREKKVFSTCCLISIKTEMYFIYGYSSLIYMSHNRISLHNIIPE